MNVPKYLWSEAVLTTTYLINRMPSRILGMKSLAELLLGHQEFKVPPKVFGCVCFFKDHRPSVAKLDPQAVKCVFVGYSSTQKGYKCWDPVGKKLFVSMDVTFRESEPYYTKPWDLNLFLDEFSSVTEGDSREGEKEEDAMIVGTIPCPMDKYVTKEVVSQDDGVDMRDDDHEGEGATGDENEEVVGAENKEIINIGSGEVIVGQSIVNHGRQSSGQGEETVAKEPIVYQRSRFKNQGKSQGEQISVSQPQQPATTVPNLYSDSSPSSGDVPPNPEHV
jgi:hypothetical protein